MPRNWSNPFNVQQCSLGTLKKDRMTIGLTNLKSIRVDNQLFFKVFWMFVRC